MGKKKLLIILSVISISLIAIFGNKLLYKEEKETITNSFVTTKKKSSGIAMMLETSAGSGEYQESTDTTWPGEGYVFNETMSKCENGGELAWDNTNKVVTFAGESSDKCYVYFDVKKPTAAETITNFYTEDGVGGLYYHDGVGTYGEYEAGDGSYRFAGADPNNYVCFGSTATPCPTDNLYRIIGIFDGQMKLIKYDYATKTMIGRDGDYSIDRTPISTYKGNLTSIPWYMWNSSGSNTWSSSKLNTINLNKNFKNYLQTSEEKDWTIYIDGTKIWKVGGNSWENIGTATNSNTVYTNEITSPATADTVTAMFGLMYVSDYRYAADPTKNNSWSNLALNSYNSVVANNWMYIGEFEWTISRNSGTAITAFNLFASGSMSANRVGSDSYVYGVRPTFYLNSNVEFSSGTGTQSDPYRISV